MRTNPSRARLLRRALWVSFLLLGFVGWKIWRSPADQPSGSATTNLAKSSGTRASSVSAGVEDNGPRTGGSALPKVVAKESSPATNDEHTKRPERVEAIDRRSQGVFKPTDEQLAALEAIKKKVAGLEVRFDPVTAAPDHIMAAGRFLTPAPAAQGDDVYAPVKQFIAQNTDL